METRRITELFNLNFPFAKNIIVSGDIHGEFNTLVFKLCVRYQMRDTLLIIAGDCGFGFEKPGYYTNMLKENSGRLSKANNWIVFVRGNHDNPAYFNGKTFAYKRMIAVPDYTVIQACGKSILCIGGGISIDRKYRIAKWQQYYNTYKRFINIDSDTPELARNYYWHDETPIYNQKKLDYIKDYYAIDTVITHSAPSFCELKSKSFLEQFAKNDHTLMEDVQNEREVMCSVYQKLIKDGHPLLNWYYGHFHQSYNKMYNGVNFTMLDIMEFTAILTS